ncbi:molybdopterin converting factor subunit 1 [Tateyamaria sp. syn59]|uniref:molybdopterin converting factor subunit 1 n=1 Tax=Tateyamaria sp. syn59 TaxID=2576942 RepID=UPI0011BE4CE5|nr:molybdopterin converting factor subunit 1 [Tateyamaria sp. syn59]
MDVLYFAWVRERIGIPREAVETQAGTVMDLVEELRGKEERYAAAFADISALRVAVDQQLTDFDASLSGAREVAFFPPMTGG